MLLAAVWLAACGQQGDEPGPGPQIGSTAEADADDEVDAGGTDAWSSADVERSDSYALGQNCEAPPEQLGELAAGAPVEISRSFLEQTNQNEASCAELAPRAGVYFFSFRVAESAAADISVEVSGSGDAVVELRRDACPDPASSIYCDTSASQRTALEAGVTYYLLVQGPADSTSGQFRLTLDLQQTTCSPEERTCTGGRLDACSADGLATDSYTCSDGCGDTAACTGDSCATARTVDVSTLTSPAIFSGEQWAYTHQWNAQGRAGCTLYDGEPAGETAGPEIFFRLTGHQVGDQILFDAEGGGTTFAFYILGGCDAASCSSAGAYDDQIENRFTWRATTDEDVWVAAEVFGPPRDRPFRFEVSKQ